MESQTEEQKGVRQYLLGELSPDSQQNLEERLLTDSEFYEELLIAEDELVDQYLAGALTAPERERFEQHFLVTPARRQQLTFAAALRQYVAAAEGAAAPATEVDKPGPAARSSFITRLFSTRRPALSWALAAILLLFVSVGTWLGTSNWRARHTAGREVAANIFLVELTPGANRAVGGEFKRIVLPAAANVVRLKLELPANDYLTYQVVLQTDDKRTLYTQDNLKAQATGGAPAIFFDVPAALLTRGDYRVKLNGLTAAGAPEEVTSYSFRVAR